VRTLALAKPLTVRAAARSILDTRLENRQCADVPVVERKLLDAPLLDRLTKRRIVRAEGRAFRRHLDPLGRRSDLQREVDANLLIDVDDDAPSNLGLEPLRIDRDVVNADIDQRKGIITGRSRDDLAADLGAGVGNRHLGPVDHRACRISHYAQNRRRGGLSHHLGRQTEDNCEQ